MSGEPRVSVDPIMLMYAFRYALGSSSYCVGDVARSLIEHREALRLDWRQQIVRDIDAALEAGHAGWDCDAQLWRRVAEQMTLPGEVWRHVSPSGA